MLITLENIVVMCTALKKYTYILCKPLKMSTINLANKHNIRFKDFS